MADIYGVSRIMEDPKKNAVREPSVEEGHWDLGRAFRILVVEAQ